MRNVAASLDSAMAWVDHGCRESHRCVAMCQSVKSETSVVKKPFSVSSPVASDACAGYFVLRTIEFLFCREDFRRPSVICAWQRVRILVARAELRPGQAQCSKSRIHHRGRRGSRRERKRLVDPDFSVDLRALCGKNKSTLDAGEACAETSVVKTATPLTPDRVSYAVDCPFNSERPLQPQQLWPALSAGQHGRAAIRDGIAGIHDQRQSG